MQLLRNTTLQDWVNSLESREDKISLISILCMIALSSAADYFEEARHNLSFFLYILACLAALVAAYCRVKVHFPDHFAAFHRRLLGALRWWPRLMSRRVLLWTTGLACFGLTVVGAYASTVIYCGNFSAVIPGVVYRSAQPSSAAITRDVRRYGIKTIINLRGANPGDHWYDKEVNDAKILGLHHIDFRMSAKHELTQDQARQLIDIMASAPGPILIHCTSGSDRTGLASALYVASIAKLGEAASEAQISVRFGHLSLPFIPEYAMDRSWEKLEPWLGYRDS